MTKEDSFAWYFTQPEKRLFCLYYIVPPQDPQGENNCDVILDEWQLIEDGVEPLRTILRGPS
jgi:hypothetical protein